MPKYSSGLLVTLLSSALMLSACDNTNQSTENSSGAEDAATSTPATETEAEMIARAMEIHERVIALDTHDDINVENFTDELNYTMDTDTQVNLPKMEAGGLDVAWFIVYTGQDQLDDQGYDAAYQNAMSKFEAIHWLTKEKAPDRIGLALNSDDVRRISAEGKKVAMIGIENAYPVGLDLGNIKKFHDLGARYMSLAHNGHSQFADSNTGERVDEEGNMTEPWIHNGVGEMGREAIRLMNLYGIMVDISHPSYEANKQTIELSKAPVIASHSSARALSPTVSRNLEDDLLIALAEKGGVVQTVALDAYVDRDKNRAHGEAKNALYAEVAESMGFEILDYETRQAMTREELAAYRVKYAELEALAEPRLINEVFPVAPPVDVADFVNHIDYMVNLIGIDHVGISSDFDGGGGIHNWMDASETHNVTIELVRRGYTEEQIAALWGGNLLRVLDEVQAIAAELQAAAQ